MTNQIKTLKIKEDENFIDLRYFNNKKSFTVKLIYYIEKEELYIIKKNYCA